MKKIEKYWFKKIVDKFKKRIYNIMGINNDVSGREIQSTDGQMMQGVGGVEVSAGGDQISGKWFDPSTGLEVNVLRTIDDGNGLSIVTDKGVMSGQEFCRFIQMDANQSGVNMNSVSVNNQKPMELTGLSDKDKQLLGQITNEVSFSLDKPIPQQQISNKNPISKPVESTNYKMIDKLFNKFKDKSPIIDVKINWGDFPKEQIETLTDIFDVPKYEIADYMISKFLSKENIKEIVMAMI